MIANDVVPQTLFMYVRPERVDVLGRKLIRYTHPTARGGIRAFIGGREKGKPPNYTLHPPSGLGLGADFVRRLARRG